MNLQLDRAKVAAKLEAAGMPAAAQEQATQQVLELLQMNLISRLESELSEQQLDELATFADDQTPERITAWFSHHVPHYDQMVDETLTAIVDDIRKTVTESKAS